MTLEKLIQDNKNNKTWDNNTLIALYYSDGRSVNNLYRTIYKIQTEGWIKPFLKHEVEYFTERSVVIKDEHGNKCGINYKYLK